MSQINAKAAVRKPAVAASREQKVIARNHPDPGNHISNDTLATRPTAKKNKGRFAQKE